MADNSGTQAPRQGAAVPEPDARFARRLLAWYGRHRRHLPWRKTRDPYRIWVSEVMLQQTTVRAVIPYYEKWLAAFPDLSSLALARAQRVLRTWQGLGYYARARNMHAAARAMVREHGGRVPGDPKVLAGLPGIGPYTAAAVSSLAYNRPVPVIDANVRRVLMRVLGLDGEVGAARDALLLRRLRTFFPAGRPGSFNQAMMELGALVCRPANPACLRCPVRSWCRAEREGRQEVIPRPKRRSSERVAAAVAVIEREGRYLIHKRAPGGLLAGLWEFPGGKIEAGETPRRAVRREVREETGIRLRSVRRLGTVRHAYTRFLVTLHVFLCRPAAIPDLAPGQFRWVSLAAIRRYALPSGSVRIVDLLARLQAPAQARKEAGRRPGPRVQTGWKDRPGRRSAS